MVFFLLGVCFTACSFSGLECAGRLRDVFAVLCGEASCRCEPAQKGPRRGSPMGGSHAPRQGEGPPLRPAAARLGNPDFGCGRVSRRRTGSGRATALTSLAHGSAHSASSVGGANRRLSRR